MANQGRKSLATKMGFDVTLIPHRNGRVEAVLVDHHGTEVFRAMKPSRRTANQAIRAFVEENYPDWQVGEEPPELAPKKAAPHTDPFTAEHNRLLAKAEHMNSKAKALRLEADKLERQALLIEQAAKVLGEGVDGEE